MYEDNNSYNRILYEFVQKNSQYFGNIPNRAVNIRSRNVHKWYSSQITVA